MRLLCRSNRYGFGFDSHLEVTVDVKSSDKTIISKLSLLPEKLPCFFNETKKGVEFRHSIRNAFKIF